MNLFTSSQRGFLASLLLLSALMLVPGHAISAAESVGDSAKDIAGKPAAIPCKGRLFIIGGAADSSLKRFAEIAGGPNATILIIPHSSANPKASAIDMIKTLKGLGVKKVEVLVAGSDRALPECTGVYMTGGDQNRLLKLIKPAQVAQLKQLLQNGCVVGGSSAGAAAVPLRMIGGGMGDGQPKAGSLLLADGLGLLPGYMVDTHVNPRGRQDRLMAGMAMVEGVGGIGLDEDTAVEIFQGHATVYGAGIAHVYKRNADFSSDLPKREKGKAASVKNVTYSIYPAGESFEL